jgi:hypothetical protein
MGVVRIAGYIGRAFENPRAYGEAPQIEIIALEDLNALSGRQDGPSLFGLGATRPPEPAGWRCRTAVGFVISRVHVHRRLPIGSRTT